jgi:hypothetical protein
MLNSPQVARIDYKPPATVYIPFTSKAFYTANVRNGFQTSETIRNVYTHSRKSPMSFASLALVRPRRTPQMIFYILVFENQYSASSIERATGEVE